MAHILGRIAVFVFVAVTVFPISESCSEEWLKKGYRLNTTAPESFYTPSHDNCSETCSANQSCWSYNYHSETFLCELLNISIFTHPEKLIKAEGWVYLTNWEHKCYRETCQGRGRCTVVNDRPYCDCYLGYEGKDCEKKVDTITCRYINKRFPTAVDGQYFAKSALYPDKWFKVYCSDMNTTTPAAWLTVNPDTNVAHVSPLMRVNKKRCAAEYKSNPYSSFGHTIFHKVKISIAEMLIMRHYFNFANTTFGRNVPYGYAADCSGPLSCSLGYFKVNLSGTCVRLVDDVKWSGKIAESDINAERTVASARCGGNCGSCKIDVVLVQPTEVCD